MVARRHRESPVASAAGAGAGEQARGQQRLGPALPSPLLSRPWAPLAAFRTPGRRTSPHSPIVPVPLRGSRPGGRSRVGPQPQRPGVPCRRPLSPPACPVATATIPGFSFSVARHLRPIGAYRTRGGGPRLLRTGSGDRTYGLPYSSSAIRGSRVGTPGLRKYATAPLDSGLKPQ
jgi:hypothetical protein